MIIKEKKDEICIFGAEIKSKWHLNGFFLPDLVFWERQMLGARKWAVHLKVCAVFRKLLIYI